MLVSLYKFSLMTFLSYFIFVGWSSVSWLILWFIMEITFMMFMGLISSFVNYSSVNFMMKYFLVQVFISMIIFTFFLIYSFGMGSFLCELSIISFLCKVGVFPFHYWLIMTVGKLNWLSYFFLSTLMKMIPLLFVYYLLCSLSLGVFMIIVVIAGSFLGLNNLVIQKLMVYSSMIHICWLLLCLTLKCNLFYFYSFVYFSSLFLICLICSYIGSFYLNQFKFSGDVIFSSKLTLFFCSLSLSGFPPMLGFLIKWVVYMYMYTMNYWLIMISVLWFSVFSTYFYFQIFFYFFIVFGVSCKWVKLGLTNLFLLLMLYFIISGIFFLWFIF